MRFTVFAKSCNDEQGSKFLLYCGVYLLLTLLHNGIKFRIQCALLRLFVGLGLLRILLEIFLEVLRVSEQRMDRQ